MTDTVTRHTFADFADLAAEIPGVVAVERVKGVGGFWVKLANGWTVSVQVRPATNCDNRDRFDLLDRWTRWVVRNVDIAEGERLHADLLAATTTAEIAYWPPGDDGMQPFVDDEEAGGDVVKGYVPHDEVLRFIAFVGRLP